MNKDWRRISESNKELERVSAKEGTNLQLVRKEDKSSLQRDCQERPKEKKKRENIDIF